MSHPQFYYSFMIFFCFRFFAIFTLHNFIIRGNFLKPVSYQFDHWYVGSGPSELTCNGKGRRELRDHQVHLSGLWPNFSFGYVLNLYFLCYLLLHQKCNNIKLSLNKIAYFDNIVNVAISACYALTLLIVNTRFASCSRYSSRSCSFPIQ